LETGDEVFSRFFSLGLTITELVHILQGRMCVFYYRGFPIFDDHEQLVISYPRGLGPAHVQFIGQTATPLAPAMPLEAMPAAPALARPIIGVSQLEAIKIQCSLRLLQNQMKAEHMYCFGKGLGVRSDYYVAFSTVVDAWLPSVRYCS
jgi:hypothetical protein